MRVDPQACPMPHDRALINALAKVLKEKPRPLCIIETGTYQGLGSTQLLIKAVKKVMKRPNVTQPILHTIEIDENNYLEAKNNLRDYFWITVHHGCSIDAKEAREFIKTDEALLTHEDYPNVLIDEADDPVNFYLDELAGRKFRYGHGGRDNILLRLMPEIYKQRPLFVLDSAGGTGWLEFQRVVEWMGNHRYSMLLDDVTHLKHFRSAAYVKYCKWPILYENERCLLALHPGNAGRPKERED